LKGENHIIIIEGAFVGLNTCVCCHFEKWCFHH